MARDRGNVLDFHKVLAAEDFGFLQAYEALLRRVYLDDVTLDRRTRELIYVAALISAGGLRSHIRAQMEAALQAGATPRQFLSVVEQCLLPAGLPSLW